MIRSGGENIARAPRSSASSLPTGRGRGSSRRHAGSEVGRGAEGVRAAPAWRRGDRGGSIAHCGNLAPFKVPKALEIVDHLPRNDSGKVLKRALRDPGQSAAADLDAGSRGTDGRAQAHDRRGRGRRRRRGADDDAGRAQAARPRTSGAAAADRDVHRHRAPGSDRRERSSTPASSSSTTPDCAPRWPRSTGVRRAFVLAPMRRRSEERKARGEPSASYHPPCSGSWRAPTT